MSFVQDLYVNNNLTVINDSTFGGDVEVSGNLSVLGTTTSVSSINLNVTDRHVYLNKDYTTTVGQSGGIVVNFLPTATVDTVSATGFLTTSTVATSGAAVFVVGDIIQISGTVGDVTNSGVFEVLSHAANVLTIKGVGAAVDFAQTEFVVDTTVGANITKVTVSVMQTNTTGVWQSVVGTNSVTDFTTKNLLLSGDPINESSITLTDETDQINLGTDGILTLSGIASSGNDATITFPDTVGVNDTVVLQTLVQDVSNKTLISTKFADTSNDHNYVITVNELTSDRNTELPLLISDDVFVFESHIQTLSNKTLASPVTTGQITSANGTAGAPTYSFSNYTDAGMYVDSDSINLAYGGIDVLTANGDEITFAGDVTVNISNITESVKAYTGAGAHLLGTDGKRVNYVTGAVATTVTLPTSTELFDGLKYTIINKTTGNKNLVINTAGSETIEGNATMTLPVTNHRVTLQYIAALTDWFIV